jgi:hypothetical protein
MPDRRLLQFLAWIAVLNFLHILDHLFRGDFHWPMDEQSVGFLIVVTIIFGGMGLGTWLYRTGLVGPLFWVIIGLLGLGLGWFSHFSPMTDQPVPVIYHAYAWPLAGALAVGCLFMLLLTVLGATIYAGLLWLGQRCNASS